MLPSQWFEPLSKKLRGFYINRISLCNTKQDNLLSLLIELNNLTLLFPNTKHMTKKTFSAVFIILSAIILIALNEFNLIEAGIEYALIPIIIAFLVGQYSERKFKS